MFHINLTTLMLMVLIRDRAGEKNSFDTVTAKEIFKDFFLIVGLGNILLIIQEDADDFL